MAFDHEGGIFYTQVDPDGSGKKVFRHQIGTVQEQDVLIYEELSQEFRVSISNTQSQDYIMINIEPWQGMITVRFFNACMNTAFPLIIAHLKRQALEHIMRLFN